MSASRLEIRIRRHCDPCEKCGIRNISPLEPFKKVCGGCFAKGERTSTTTTNNKYRKCVGCGKMNILIKPGTNYTQMLHL